MSTLTPTFIIPPFTSSNAGETLVSVDWLVTDDTGHIIHKSALDTVNLTSYTVPYGKLAANIKYRAYARYNGTVESSPYGVAEFLTDDVVIDMPTFVVEGEANNVPANPEVTTSAFVSSLASEVHVGTDIIFRDATDTIVYSKNLRTSNGDNLTVHTLPLGTLTADTVYRVSVRHIGTATVSAWRDKEVRTSVAAIADPTLVIEGEPNNIDDSPLFTLSPLQVIAGAVGYVDTEWEVYDDTGFMIFNGLYTGNPDPAFVNPAMLQLGNILNWSFSYRVRARYIGTLGVTSSWVERSFTVKAEPVSVLAPTYVFSGLISGDVPHNPVIITGEYRLSTDTVGAPTAGTHLSTEYYFTTTDINGTEIILYSNNKSSGDLQYLTTPDGTLPPNKIIDVHVRFVGSEGVSPYTVVQVTTPVVTMGTPTLTVTGYPLLVPKSPTLYLGNIVISPPGYLHVEKVSWKLFLLTDLVNPIWESLENTIDLDQIKVPNGLLNLGVAYQAQATMLTELGDIPGFAPTQTITFTPSADIAVPTLINPANGVLQGTSGQVITTSAFNYTGPASEFHTSTSWRIVDLSNAANNLVFIGTSANGQLEQLNISPGFLEYGGNYTLTVTYHTQSTESDPLAAALSVPEATLEAPTLAVVAGGTTLVDQGGYVETVSVTVDVDASAYTVFPPGPPVPVDSTGLVDGTLTVYEYDAVATNNLGAQVFQVDINGLAIGNTASVTIPALDGTGNPYLVNGTDYIIEFLYKGELTSDLSPIDGDKAYQRLNVLPIAISQPNILSQTFDPAKDLTEATITIEDFAVQPAGTITPDNSVWTIKRNGAVVYTVTRPYAGNMSDINNMTLPAGSGVVAGDTYDIEVYYTGSVVASGISTTSPVTAGTLITGVPFKPSIDTNENTGNAPTALSVFVDGYLDANSVFVPNYGTTPVSAPYNGQTYIWEFRTAGSGAFTVAPGSLDSNVIALPNSGTDYEIRCKVRDNDTGLFSAYSSILAVHTGINGSIDPFNISVNGLGAGSIVIHPEGIEISRGVISHAGLSGPVEESYRIDQNFGVQFANISRTVPNGSSSGLDSGRNVTLNASSDTFSGEFLYSTPGFPAIATVTVTITGTSSLGGGAVTRAASLSVVLPEISGTILDIPGGTNDGNNGFTDVQVGQNTLNVSNVTIQPDSLGVVTDPTFELTFDNTTTLFAAVGPPNVYFGNETLNVPAANQVYNGSFKVYPAFGTKAVSVPFTVTGVPVTNIWSTVTSLSNRGRLFGMGGNLGPNTAGGWMTMFGGSTSGVGNVIGSPFRNYTVYNSSGTLRATGDNNSVGNLTAAGFTTTQTPDSVRGLFIVGGSADGVNDTVAIRRITYHPTAGIGTDILTAVLPQAMSQLGVTGDAPTKLVISGGLTGEPTFIPDLSLPAPTLPVGVTASDQVYGLDIGSGGAFNGTLGISTAGALPNPVFGHTMFKSVFDGVFYVGGFNVDPVSGVITSNSSLWYKDVFGGGSWEQVTTSVGGDGLFVQAVPYLGNGYDDGTGNTIYDAMVLIIKNDGGKLVKLGTFDPNSLPATPAWGGGQFAPKIAIKDRSADIGNVYPSNGVAMPNGDQNSPGWQMYHMGGSEITGGGISKVVDPDLQVIKYLPITKFP